MIYKIVFGVAYFLVVLSLVDMWYPQYWEGFIVGVIVTLWYSIIVLWWERNLTNRRRRALRRWHKLD